MRHKDRIIKSEREHHPLVGFGLFLILLGVALLIATNDWLHLGSVKAYFTWQSALIFIGALLMLNMKFTPGIILAAVGLWFWFDDHFYHIPDIVRTIYWPVVLMTIGLIFILTSVIRRSGKQQ